MKYLNLFSALIIIVFANLFSLSVYGSSISATLVSSSLNDKEKLSQYSCPKGFQTISNLHGVLCVQQEKVSFRPSLPCSTNDKGLGKYFLRVDMLGQKDLCSTLNNLSGRSSESVNPTFPPKCKQGYVLDVRHGRDACQKRTPKKVMQPFKKPQ
jgi:hypothetical protein